MLDHIAADEAPDKTSCWTAFSGLFDDDVIKSADWGDRRPKNPSASSAAVYDIDQFNKSTGSATMNSPAPNVAYNLTVAKVKASERPADYEALEPAEPAKATFSKGKGAAKKRKRDDGDGASDEDDDGSGMDDDDDEGACYLPST